MDLYIASAVLGILGLAVMAFAGVGRHGGGHASGGHGHASHPGHAGHGPASGGHGLGAGARIGTWMLMSPRYLFAALIGFGATGMMLRPLLGGVLLLAAAIAGAVLIERVLVTPLWNFALRFASNPATTLDGAVTAEATAVTTFDRNGQGIISVEVDGQVQQVLATLTAGDRAAGVTVRAGQRVRIEDVDGARHQCRVSRM